VSDACFGKATWAVTDE
jgi:uncharacterized protein YpmB